MRKNDKIKVVDFDNSIKKSNEFSMAKLNQGLTLNQMQLLAYAIYSTQQDGKTRFNKYEFEKKFGLAEYRTEHAKSDAQRILDLKFSIEDLENDIFEYYNVFQSIKYDKGVFSFSWTDDMVPHILELQERYVTTDLTIAAKFKSGFSWTLYEHLKAHHGWWNIALSKEALMNIFGVEDRLTYQKNTARFKKTVLDVAIKEINEYTELEVWYEEIKEGRSIVAFDLSWSSGTNQSRATNDQMLHLRNISTLIQDNLFYYLDLKNEQSRIQSMEKVRELTEMSLFWKNMQGQLSYEKADEAIKNSKGILSDLEFLLETDENYEKRDTSVYFNWLEESGDE